MLKIEKLRKNINLTSVDDLFTAEERRIDENREKVQEIPLSELYTFKYIALNNVFSYNIIKRLYENGGVIFEI